MGLRLRSRARRCAAFSRKGFMVRGAICGGEALDIVNGTAEGPAKGLVRPIFCKVDGGRGWSSGLGAGALLPDGPPSVRSTTSFAFSALASLSWNLLPFLAIFATSCASHAASSSFCMASLPGHESGHGPLCPFEENKPAGGQCRQVRRVMPRWVYGTLASKRPLYFSFGDEEPEKEPDDDEDLAMVDVESYVEDMMIVDVQKGLHTENLLMMEYGGTWNDIVNVGH
jgi:hypothetical protein